MLRPVALVIGALIAVALIVHVESCYRCESGIIESKYCGPGSDMKTCFNEDRPVLFRTPFMAKPMVVVDITGYYYDQGTNGRMVTKPRKKTNEGFTVRMQTWEDTHFYFMNVSYMACGQLPDV